jgi:putative transcriptional regulator
MLCVSQHWLDIVEVAVCSPRFMKNRIRVLRAERPWSQAELASRVDVSRNSIISIENGHFGPSLPLAFAIAHAIERKVEEVFEWEPKNRKPST